MRAGSLREDDMDRSVEAADRRFAELGGSQEHVPPGPYCYGVASGWKTKPDGTPYFETSPCPYWGLDATRDRHESGYCALLKEGDWQVGWGILWDQVKHCGIRRDDEDDLADEVTPAALQERLLSGEA